MNAVYSDAELETMMVDLESDLVERKRTGADGKAIRKNICAFANDLPGNRRPGVILVGVEDDGGCSNTLIDDELLTRLAQTRSDGNIQPLPSLTVQKRILKGCAVAVVFVEPSQDPPVRYRGRVWVRIGPSVVVAAAADERRLVERRRSANAPFDLQPVPNATPADLDQNYFLDSYLPLAIATDVLEKNERSPSQQLHSLRLLSGGRPTWGGLLAFGRETQHWLPGAYVPVPPYRRPSRHGSDPQPKDRVRAAERRPPSGGRASGVEHLGADGYQIGTDRTSIARLSDRGAPATGLQRDHASQLRGNQRSRTHLLVRGSGRDPESGRALRRRDPRQRLRRRDRLQESAGCRDHAQSRVRTAVRLWRSAGTRRTERERQSRSRVRLPARTRRRDGGGQRHEDRCLPSTTRGAWARPRSSTTWPGCTRIWASTWSRRISIRRPT